MALTTNLEPRNNNRIEKEKKMKQYNRKAVKLNKMIDLSLSHPLL